MERTQRVGRVLLDKVLSELSKAGDFELKVRRDLLRCDRHIDDHHTAEDVAITLGQCMFKALGNKAGITRMGCGVGESSGAAVRAVLDLSNRPHFESTSRLTRSSWGALGWRRRTTCQ